MTAPALRFERFVLANPTNEISMRNGQPCDNVVRFRDGYDETRDGGSRPHHGIDIFAPRRTEVVLPVRAKLISTTRERGPGGNTGHGVTFAYRPDPRQPGAFFMHFAHFDERPNRMQVGQSYPAGTLLGLVGNSGNASGSCPHLHFHVEWRENAARPGEVRVNPFAELARLAPSWCRVQGAPARAPASSAAAPPAASAAPPAAAGDSRPETTIVGDENRSVEDIIARRMSPAEFARQLALLRNVARSFRITQTWWDGDSTRTIAARLARENLQARVRRDTRLIDRLHRSRDVVDVRMAEAELEALKRYVRGMHRFNVELTDRVSAQEASGLFGQLGADVTAWYNDAARRIREAGDAIVDAGGDVLEAATSGAKWILVIVAGGVAYYLWTRGREIMA